VDAIFCIDLPGHGLSEGIRGHIENFDQYSDAVIAGFNFACEWMASRSKLTKIHWFGHSLGGLITLRTLLKYRDLKLNSVAVSAPLLDIAVPVPALKKFFGELFEPLISKVKLSNELDGSLVSHDPEVSAAYDKDPLNHGFVTPRFFVQLTKEMGLVRNQNAEFPYPLMMVVPLGDRIVSWKANLQFFVNLKMANGKKKNLVSLPSYYHESFNDFGKERPFNALMDWIIVYN
jgi:lysophospholipase